MNKNNKFSKKVTIIAEAGVNHNGSIHNAYKLIKLAKLCGADFVKFQIFKSVNVVTKIAKKSKYQKKNQHDKESQLEMIKKLELNYEFYKKIKKRCKKSNIKFLCSPFDLESLNFLKSLKEKIIKIPSGEVTNFPLLREIGLMKNKVIMSTGMCNLKEIGQAIKTLIRFGTKKKNITVLHCVTSYPAPFNSLSLHTMNTIKKNFNVNVGFSDHSIGIEASLAAVALGAGVIEKHLTIDKKLNGPDHRSSLDAKEFSLMVKNIRNIEKAIIGKKKELKKCEMQNIKLVRKSIVAKINIKKGEKFTEQNLTTKRPGYGLDPIKWEKVIGKKAKKKYLKDEFI